MERILILDDNELDAELIKLEVEKLEEDVDIRICTSGTEYELILPEFLPDVVLSDYNLPQYNGLKALHFLQEIKLNAPLIFITGFLPPTEAVKLIKEGAEDFILKDDLAPLLPAIIRALRNAEARLEARKQHELLQTISSVSKTGGWRLDKEPERLYWSDVICDIFEVPYGFTPMLDEAMAYFKEGWSRDLINQRVAETYETGKGYDEEVQIVTAKGNVRWIRTMGNLLLEDGEVTGIFGIARDITEERAQRAEKEKQHALLETISTVSGTGGWELDVETESIYWSKITREIHEVADDYLPVLETGINFYTEGWSREMITKAVEEAMSKGKPYNLELTIETAKGNVVWVRTVCQPIMENGKCVRLIGTFKEITEERAQQAEKEKQHALLEAISTVSGTGGWELDLVNNKLEWSSVTKQIHGVPESFEPSLESAIEFYTEGWSRDKISELVNNAIEDGKPFDAELTVKKANGDVRWVRTQGEPFFENNKCTRLFGTFEDITEERKSREEKLKLAERQKNVLEATKAGTLDWDIVNNEIIIDENVARIGGYHIEEIASLNANGEWYASGFDMQRFFDVEDEDRVLQVVQDHVLGITDKIEVEFRALPKDSSMDLWVLVKGSITERDDEGNAVRGYATIIDITESKQVELERQSNAAQLANITKNIPGVVARHEFDAEGNLQLTYLSKRVKDFFGESSEKLIRDKELFESFVHPDDREQFWSALQNAVLKQEPYSILFRIQVKDKIKWLQSYGAPEIGDNGTIVYDSVTLEVTDLQTTKKNFESMFQWNPLPLGIVDADRFQVLKVNREAEKLYGYSEDEFGELTITQLGAGDLSEADFAEYVKPLLEHNEVQKFGIAQKKKNGEVMQVEVSFKRFNYHDRPCFMVAINDITKELEAQKELQKLSVVAEKATNAVMITDAYNKVVWCNKSQQDAVGYTLDELIGKPAEMLFSDTATEEQMHAVANAIRQEKTVKTEVTLRRKDGSSFWADLIITPVKDAEGDVTNFIGISNDITERKQNQEELARVLHELEQEKFAVDQHSVVIITDTDGTIEYVNEKAEQLTGYSRKELIGKNPRIVNSGYYPKDFFKNLYSTLQSGNVWHGILRNKNKQGEFYWQRTSITPFTDAETGKPYKFIAISTDITARVEVENKLRDTLDNLEELVEERTKELATAHQSLVDSVNYAQRLQLAVLPDPKALSSAFEHAFVILKPKDIVSGDFYWFHERQHEVIVSLVDCTGHGVPGAMMSMLANELLESVVVDKGLDRPDVVLEEIDASLTSLLTGGGKQLAVSDGMDMSVVTIDYRSGLFSYSGARSHGLFYSRSKEKLTPLVPDRYSIGGMLYDKVKDFTRTRFTFEKGDRVFLFSDGFYDQFGGPDKKKFLRSRFNNLIDETATLPVEAQQQQLEKALQEWMGTEPQVDDITVLGIEL